MPFVRGRGRRTAGRQTEFAWPTVHGLAADGTSAQASPGVARGCPYSPSLITESVQGLSYFVLMQPGTGQSMLETISSLPRMSTSHG